MADLLNLSQNTAKPPLVDFSDDVINISGVPSAVPSKTAAAPFEQHQPSAQAQTQVKPPTTEIKPLPLPVAQSQAEAGLLASTKDLVEETRKGNEQAKEEAVSAKNKSNFLAGARFALDVHNANSAYNAIAINARFHVQDARNSSWDAIERGRQRALEAKAEGQFASDDALLSLAAQGQDVSGVGAQKVVGSLEDIAAQNALQEEFDSFREAHGFDLEEVAINYQVAQADIQRTNTILSSGLNFGATVLGNTL